MKRDRLERTHYLLAQGGTACGYRGLVWTLARNKVTCKRCLAALIAASPSGERGQ